MLLQYHNTLFNLNLLRRTTSFIKLFSTAADINDKPTKTIDILKKRYDVDNWTNITPKIISLIGKDLHTKKYHPLSFVRQRIINYFYRNFKSRTDNPIFSVYDNISPVVTTFQNFDSLLIPEDHPSRSKNDCYYINCNYLMRAHTTAHQSELINMGLNNFLVVGEVFRRDEIDVKHYPVFHQMDAVRTVTSDEVFMNVENSHNLQAFEKNGIEDSGKQACHSLEAVKVLAHEMKTSLVGVAQELFGKDIKYRWTDQYFPFTHPSWELEIFYNNEWLEICGCGIMRQSILEKAGAPDRIGWAFGLGLERLAMCLYDIPDIRWFQSMDSGFLHQFEVNDIYTPIKFKLVSSFPQCSNDLSFWIPEDNSYSPNDFYDLARDVGRDIVEQIKLIDEFVHPKTKRVSHCYRIVYRHMNRVLTQKEVSQIHNQIKLHAEKSLNVVLR